MNLLRTVFIFTLIYSASQTAYAVNCDGKITQVLSGNAYCTNGERLGFAWTGGGATTAGTGYLCSANKNMDALIMAAYASGKNISVRNDAWTSCFNHPNGTVPNHIWFQ